MIFSTGALETMDDAALHDTYREVTQSDPKGLSRSAMVQSILATLHHRQHAGKLPKSDRGRIEMKRLDFDKSAPRFRTPLNILPRKLKPAYVLTPRQEALVRLFAKGVSIDDVRETQKLTWETVRTAIYRLSLTNGYGFIETPGGIVYLLKPL